MTALTTGTFVGPVRKVLVIVVGAAVALLTSLAAGAASSAASALSAPRFEPPRTFAPIVSSVLTRPTPAKATDGRFHIVYEVVLTNNTPYTMAVEGFEVRDARTRRVLARLSGPALAANMGPVAGPPGPEIPRTSFRPLACPSRPHPMRPRRWRPRRPRSCGWTSR